MKKILYLLLLTILFCSCNYKNESNKKNDNLIETMEIDTYGDRKYTINDYITKKFKIYEIKKDITSILDSIIESTNNCELFKNTQIIYSVSINYYLDKINISIPEYRHYDLLLYDADALFFYKGYQFMYFGNFFNRYFKETDVVVERHCIKPVEISPDEIFIDDSVRPLSYWNYSYENDTLSIIGVYHCGKSWFCENL